ncbi:hypothetical protein CHUAL_008513 [Chamberlinius hualienensis]
METYNSSIYPLIVILRVFGVELTKIDGQIKLKLRFTCKLLKWIYYMSQLSLLGYLLWFSTFSKRKVLEVMYYIAFVAIFMLSLVSRLAIDVAVDDFILIIEETAKIMMRFNGLEQPFLRKLRIFVVFSATNWTIAFLFNLNTTLYDSEFYFFTATGLTNESVTSENYVYFANTFGVPMLIIEGWLSLIQIVIITQLLALYLIFKLVHESCFVIGNRSDFLRNFISLHRRACHLVESFNGLFKNILGFWISMKCFVALFKLVEYLITEDQSAIVALCEAITIVCVHIILAGSVNKMVIKCLENLQFLVQRNFSSRKAARLSAKLELYSVHTNLWKPFLKIGGTSQLTSATAIIVLDYMLTYMLFVYTLHQESNT